jgi:uncharacterized LabA/DUF88 family protein
MLESHSHTSKGSISVSDEIALFIDFENIRYSLINVQHREPDPQELIGVARRYGTVMVARAYADWSRQPEFFKGSLTAAMIDRVDCPAKVRDRFRQGAMPSYATHSGYERAASRVDEAEEEFTPASPESPDLSAEATKEALAVETVENTMVATEAEEDAERADSADEEGEEDRSGRYEHGYGSGNGNYGNGGYTNGNGGYYPGQSQTITQSTVDLNMLMDIIETVFDRPSINTFVLMSGDRDFTRICARLKLRLNKHVIVAGVPGTVSRDLISAAEQFLPLGYPGAPSYSGPHQRGPQYGPGYPPPAGLVEPEEPGFIQFLDYIDRHWSWRTVSGVANFIGDPFNPKNRFRGRLTRDSARDLLRICVDEGILIQTVDPMGGENLRLNREHPAVVEGLTES